MRKPCCDKKRNNKGAWSKQEDQKLIDYIKIHGEGCWRSLPQAAGLHRCGKSCRLRWINYLRPDIKRGNFEDDEEDLIVKLHALLGNRWSLIAGRLPGRTDNEVKNYWNSHLRKKLIKVGIDPNNHKLNQVIPRTPEADSESSRSSKSHDAKMKHKAGGTEDDVEGRVSECCSSKEAEKEETCCESSKLDLNLCIGLPSSSTHEIQSKSVGSDIPSQSENLQLFTQ